MKRILGVALLVVLGLGQVVSAGTISPFTTVYGTDWTISGLSGLRDLGGGALSVAGVSGPVTAAYLFWHGPTNSRDLNANASIIFNGNRISGVNIGQSQDNNWGYLNSQAYRADVTSFVTGNGAYLVSDMVKSGGDINVNGASLAVFFDDGNSLNDRDVVIFNGNDSNISSVFDPAGWQASLSGINYSGGSASMVLGVSDGQDFGNDEAVFINGLNVLIPVGPTWQGDTLPNAGGGVSNGKLWDIRAADVTGYLSMGPNTLTLETFTPLTDALSLIHLMVDLPAGAAPPPQGTVPEPATLAMWSLGILGLGIYRRRGRSA